jgi:hypothetical protein
MSQPRKRARLLTPKEKTQFYKEYEQASAEWGAKKKVCEKWGVSDGYAANIFEELSLGKENRRRWASYNAQEQGKILAEYDEAPTSDKRKVAAKYGLLTRDINSVLSKWRQGKWNRASAPRFSNAPPREPKPVAAFDTLPPSADRMDKSLVENILLSVRDHEITPQAAMKLLFGREKERRAPAPTRTARASSALDE